MATTNVKATVVANQDKQLSSFEILQRTCAACMLWENNFYEDGESVVDRVKNHIGNISKEEFKKLIILTKNDNKLRHMPLLLLSLGAQHKLVDKSDVLKCITRVDDMTELLSIYWSLNKDKKSLPMTFKKGLKESFEKFDEYQFAKYRGIKKAIKLRDVVRIVHPAPSSNERSQLYKKIIEDTLKTPDTWEVELSQSKDKTASWTRLVEQNRLGSLAFLRNLRNMMEASLPKSFVDNHLKDLSVSRVLPFQLMAAARARPEFEPTIETLMFKNAKEFKKLPGNTLLHIDVSGSMACHLSSKGDISRLDCAKTIAMILREICENVYMYTFNTNYAYINPRRGFAIGAEIGNACGGTDIKSTLYSAYKETIKKCNEKIDRVIVITDEQENYSRFYTTKNKKSVDTFLKNIPSHNYMINIGVYENGILYDKLGKWTHINGFSENVIKYISEMENR